MNSPAEIESLWNQLSECDLQSQGDTLVKLFHLLKQAGSDDCVAVGTRAVEGFLENEAWEDALDLAQDVSTILGEHGRLNEARDLLSPLIPLGTLVDSRTAGLLRWTYGYTLSQLGETADALFEYEQATEIFPVDCFFARAALIQSQAQMLRKLSRLGEAKKRLLHAIDLFKKAANLAGAGRCELELAELQVLDDPQSGLHHANRALRIFEFAGQREELLKAKLVCGRCCLAVGEFEEAQILLSYVADAREVEEHHKIAAEASFYLAERNEMLGEVHLSRTQFRSIVPVLESLNLVDLAKRAIRKGEYDD